LYSIKRLNPAFKPPPRSSDPEILKSAKDNKINFWDESWEPYKNINSFSDIEIIPTQDSRLKELELDYEKMKEMFFDKYPNFLDIINELKKFKKSLL
jgi:hypothetical protein